MEVWKEGNTSACGFLIMTVIVNVMVGCSRKGDLSVVSVEEEQAMPYIGEGYSIAVPEDEWVEFAPASWYALENENVRFWVSDHYAELDQGQMERILTNQGYQVEEGYDIGAVTPGATMPEGEHPLLSEGMYADETSRNWALQDPEYTGNYVYNELVIRDVTEHTFDFEIVCRDYETDESETFILQGTANIGEDGLSAVYEGGGYTLNFDFFDSANPLPTVVFIKLWGEESLEGIIFANYDVPGYDAG